MYRFTSFQPNLPHGTGVVSMTYRSLSYSQALRVIGQQLADLEIDVFELINTGDLYAVHIDPNSVAGQLANGRTATHHIRQTIHPRCRTEIPVILEFTPAELRWCDDQNRLQRIRPAALPVVGNLSLMLRVLGDFIDRKALDVFTISWSRYSVKLSYGDVEHSFSAHNIYDLGIVMYLKRFDYRPGKSDALGREAPTNRPTYGIQLPIPSYE
jgi:hypothetical protein